MNHLRAVSQANVLVDALTGIAMFVACLALATIALPARAADASLEGCWRSLHVATRLANGRINHVHNNCSIAFSKTDARTDCQFPKGGHYVALARLSLAQPDRMTLSLLSSNSIEKQSLSPLTLDYLLEGDYLVLRQTLSPPKDAPADAPVEITRVLMRMAPLGSPKGASSKPLCLAPAP